MSFFLLAHLSKQSRSAKVNVSRSTKQINILVQLVFLFLTVSVQLSHGLQNFFRVVCLASRNILRVVTCVDFWVVHSSLSADMNARTASIDTCEESTTILRMTKPWMSKEQETHWVHMTWAFQSQECFSVAGLHLVGPKTAESQIAKGESFRTRESEAHPTNAAVKTAAVSWRVAGSEHTVLMRALSRRLRRLKLSPGAASYIRRVAAWISEM